MPVPGNNWVLPVGKSLCEFGTVGRSVRILCWVWKPVIILGCLHSGSRALGANIANYYTKIAISKRRLPQDAKNLAWLSLDEEAGIEYWNAMNLAVI